MREYLLWSFLALAVLWISLSGLVLLNRLWHEWGTRRLKAVTDRLESPDLAALPPLARAPKIKQILRTRSRRAVYRMIARPTTSDTVAEACAIYAIDRWGIDQLIHDASAPGRRTKWRRVSALLALAHLREPHAHGLLAVALASRDDDVAAAAVVGLTRLGDDQAAGILVEAIRRKHYAPSRIATQLERFSVPIDDYLRPLLTDGESHSRYWAASILASSPYTPTLATSLLPLTDDPDPSVRKVAIEALSQFPDRRIVTAARARLSDPAPYVRGAAVRALTCHVPPLPEARQRRAVQEIAQRLADESWDVRNAAKEALVTLGARYWKEVAVHLDSADAFARNGAAEVLQNIQLLDEVIEAVSGGEPVDPEIIRVLTRAFEEGGPMMFDAAVARTEGHALPQVANLLAGMGLRTAT